MYQLTFNNYIILDPRLDDLKILEPKAHLAVNQPGSLNFSIFADHPNYSRLTKLKNTLELTEDGVVIYRGRITKDTSDFDNIRQIESEGLLACLNDSVIPPHSFPKDFESRQDYQASLNRVEYYLNWLLLQHNSQVENEQQIKLGTVTVTDVNNYIFRETSDYSNSWSYISEKLPNSSLGGYLLPRYENDGVYLDYLAELPLTNTQTVEFGENLIDLVIEKDAANIHTAILPVGSEGLTIEEKTDGDITTDVVKSGKIVYSKSLVERYGKITKIVKFDDVTDINNLESKAVEALALEGLAETIKVKACDLHIVDGHSSSFRVGRKTRLVSDPHNISALYPLTELDIDLGNPGATEITFGASGITQTDFFKKKTTKLSEDIQLQRIEFNKTEERIIELKQSTLENITAAIQSSEGFVLTALQEYVETGNFEEFKESISTQFELTSDSISLNFNTAIEEINRVNEDLQTLYEERKKYIRFEDGNIILGEEGNLLILQIQNDKISFFENGFEIAYWQNRKFYAVDGEFINSLRIGDFGFAPRANGNLSFRKVK